MIRVSTDEQADKGYSQREQDESLTRYAKLFRIEIVARFFEDYSGKTFNRPEFNKMMLSIKKHKGIVNRVLFTKWDRFGRNTADSYLMIRTLNKLGVTAQATTQPLDMKIPESKLMLAYYLAQPEVENDRRALNVTAGMRRAQKEGRWMATAPFGYINRVGTDGQKYIEVVEEKAAVVNWFFQKVAEAHYTVESLITQGRKMGLTLEKHGCWVMLRNPIYCGKIRVKAYEDEPEQIVNGKHEPIISEVLFANVQDVLNGKKKQQRTAVEVDSRFPLRGHLVCQDCGRLLTASASKGCRQYYSYYHCTGKCKARFAAQKVEDYLVKELGKLCPHPAVVKLYEEVLQEVMGQNERERRLHLSALQKELEAVTTRKKKALELLLAEKIGSDDYGDIKQEADRRIIQLDAEIEELRNAAYDISGDVSTALRMLSHIDELYLTASTEDKREIISSIFPEKLIFSGEHIRTIRHNEVISLIFNVGVGLNEIEKPAEAGLQEKYPGVFPQRLELWAR